MQVAGILKPDPKREVKVTGPPRVRTVPIEPWEEELTLDIDGSVVPFREVSVTAEVAGRIISKSDACRAGKYVKAGTLLYEINPVDFNLRKQQLTKQVRQAEINLHQVDVEMENMRSLIDLAIEDGRLQQDEVSRLQRLVADGASSSSELDRSRRGEIATRNSLEQLKNQARLMVTRRAAQQSAIEVATSQLEQAELDLKRTKITAPIDGVIVNEMIQNETFVPVGAQLVTIEDTASVEVLCNLRSEQLFQLWESRPEPVGSSDGGPSTNYELPRVPATVIYEVAGRKFAWEGRLDRYDGLGLDQRTRTVPIRVIVPDPQSGRPLAEGSRLRPPALVRGMFVNVELSVDTQTRQLAKLPAGAVRPGKVIYRIEDNKLKIEKVRLARLTSDYAVLETDGADFSIGDSVIVTPLPSPKDGMQVELAKDKESQKSRAPKTSDDSEDLPAPEVVEDFGASPESPAVDDEVRHDFRDVTIEPASSGSREATP